MGIYNFFRCSKHKDWAWHEAYIQSAAINMKHTFNNPALIDTYYLQAAVTDARNYLKAKPDSAKKQERLKTLDNQQNIIDQMDEKIDSMGRKDLLIGAAQAVRGARRIVNEISRPHM